MQPVAVEQLIDVYGVDKASAAAAGFCRPLHNDEVSDIYRKEAALD